MSTKSDMRHWSIDLETLDNKYSSAIVSIGAVQFDRDTGEIGIRHYAKIDLDSAMKSGTVSGSTLAWWMRHDKAREVFNEKEKTPLACALAELSTIIRSKTIGAYVWGNGSSFDITILEHAFINGAHGLAIPWGYQQIRDMRTIREAAGLDLCDVPPVGTAHNAVDDAEFQALAISMAWRRIREGLGHTMPKWKGPALPGAKKVAPPKPAPVPAPVIDEDDEL